MRSQQQKKILKIQVLHFFIIILNFQIAHSLSCRFNQFLATTYQQNDKLTQYFPFQICLDESLTAGTLCKDAKYYSTIFVGNKIYRCIQCNDQYVSSQSNLTTVNQIVSHQIQLDSGTNYCGYYRFYDPKCSMYSSLNPVHILFQINSANNSNDSNSSIGQTIKQNIYNFISCKNSSDWFLPFFISDSQNQTIQDYFCTGITPIYGKNGGQSCLFYYSQQLDFTNDALSTNLICSQCKLSAKSIDCSFSCKQNEYQIQYGANFQNTKTICLSGGGSKGFDNIYANGYKYECILYSSYDSSTKTLGNCIQQIPPPNSVLDGVTFHAGKIGGCSLIDYTLTKCLICNSGYLLRQSLNDCIKIIPNCKNYSVSGQCSQCLYRYYLLNRECVLVQNECVDYTSTGTCLQCVQNYIIVNSKCASNNIQKPLNFKINGCYYQIQQKCVICLDGYKLSPDSTLCIQRVQSCPQSTNTTRFELINNVCIGIDINCKFYISSGYCYQCLRGYYQYQGQCYAQ